MLYFQNNITRNADKLHLFIIDFSGNLFETASALPDVISIEIPKT